MVKAELWCCFLVVQGLMFAARVTAGSFWADSSAAAASPQTVTESKCVSVVVAIRSSISADGELCKVEAVEGVWVTTSSALETLYQRERVENSF